MICCDLSCVQNLTESSSEHPAAAAAAAAAYWTLLSITTSCRHRASKSWISYRFLRLSFALLVIASTVPEHGPACRIHERARRVLLTLMSRSAVLTCQQTLTSTLFDSEITRYWIDSFQSALWHSVVMHLISALTRIVGQWNEKFDDWSLLFDRRGRSHYWTSHLPTSAQALERHSSRSRIQRSRDLLMRYATVLYHCNYPQEARGVLSWEDGPRALNCGDPLIHYWVVGVYLLWTRQLSHIGSSLTCGARAARRPLTPSPLGGDCLLVELRPLTATDVTALIRHPDQWFKCKIRGGETLHSGLSPWQWSCGFP